MSRQGNFCGSHRIASDSAGSLLLKEIKTMGHTIQQSYQGFGENRARYSQAADILRLSGVALNLNAAATPWTHWRYSCPTFMKQSFVEWTGESTRCSFWAKAYYE